jgi:hypothetical protein
MLPGQEVVEQGIEDLAARRETVASLLVSIGAPRLRTLGVVAESPWPDPERRLYDLLAAEDENSAHGRYNALVRRLVSYERAAECAKR